MERSETTGNASNPVLIDQSDAALTTVSSNANTTTLSLMESRQLFSDAPTSFTEMLEQKDENDKIDLNVPYVPICGSSSSSTSHCNSCGRKRKATDQSPGDPGADYIEDCQCQVNLLLDSPSQGGQANPGANTSGEGNNSNLVSARENDNRRRRSGTIRRSLPASHEPFPASSRSTFTNWFGRTSVNREGGIVHTMQAPSVSISQPGFGVGSQNSSSQVARGIGAHPNMNLPGTNLASSSQSITIFGHVITRPVRPIRNNARNSIRTSNATVQQSGNGPVGFNLSSVNEGNRGGLSNTPAAPSNTYLERLIANARRRELTMQAFAASNAPVPMSNVQHVSSTTAEHHGRSFSPVQLQARANNQRDRILLDMASSMLGRIIEYAHSHGQVLNVEGGDLHQYMRLHLNEMSLEDMIEFGNRIRAANNRLSEQAILEGLNPRRYRLGEPNEEEEQFCCICLDELGSGQDLVKLDCNHGYHFECIKQWLAEKNSCPACKRIAIPIPN